MPEPKPSKTTRNYAAQVDTQAAGLRLVRAQRPPTARTQTNPQTADGGPSRDGLAGKPHSSDAEIVSKLIDFFKSI